MSLSTGLHPKKAGMWSEEVEAQLMKAAGHVRCVAWGEMGLDYFPNQVIDLSKCLKEYTSGNRPHTSIKYLTFHYIHRALPCETNSAQCL